MHLAEAVEVLAQGAPDPFLRLLAGHHGRRIVDIGGEIRPLDHLREQQGPRAGHAAMRCYGISGMAGRGLRDGFAELLRRENVDKGVDVVQLEDGLAIDVYVIVQYGIRISEVAHNLQETVKFEVERSVNVPVTKVNVNVQGVREERS